MTDKKENTMAKKQSSKKRITTNKELQHKTKKPAAATQPTRKPKTAAATKPADTRNAPPTASEPASATEKDAPTVTAAPRTSDLRLPAAGTLLQKRDRHGAVRCECTVEEGGVRYAGKMYRSLSSAAVAAAKDLGLNNKTQNGFIFWGITKPPRPPNDLLVALERAWERYHGNMQSLIKDGVTDENRTKVVATIRKHAQTIETLRTKVA